MNLKSIRQMARNFGVKNYSRLRKEDLIHAIQEKEGHSPCFKKITDCRIMDCLWREDCQKSTLA
ncbi:MAG: hypothetical protein BZ151_03345 [Desulfobacca sp. 4484_104]|nr:MAG: hypothetical protein BZ151_03345 [Desulfobacca sp. 4484_104]RLA90904.1 MAG: hypothetical protein DRG58_00920 [Deltaproteobacteria bacterium]